MGILNDGSRVPKGYNAKAATVAAFKFSDPMVQISNHFSKNLEKLAA